MHGGGPGSAPYLRRRARIARTVPTSPSLANQLDSDTRSTAVVLAPKKGGGHPNPTSFYPPPTFGAGCSVYIIDCSLNRLVKMSSQSMK